MVNKIVKFCQKNQQKNLETNCQNNRPKERKIITKESVLKTE